MNNRGMIVNTHIGEALRKGFRKQRYIEQPKWVLLSEVGRVRARVAARLLFPPWAWSAVTGSTPRPGDVGNGCLIFVRRDWAVKKGQRVQKITNAIPGDKWHPGRWLVEGLYRHRETNNTFVLGSDHAWHVKGAKPGGVIFTQANNQIEVFAMSSEDYILDEGYDVLRGGDYNRPMTGTGLTLVEQRMADAGMRNARPGVGHPMLDAVFHSQGIKITEWRTISPMLITGDPHEHPAIVVDFKFKDQ